MPLSPDDFDVLMRDFWDRAPQMPGYFTEPVGIFSYLLVRAVDYDNSDLSPHFDELMVQLER